MYEFTSEYLGTLLIISTLAFTGNVLYVVASIAFAIALLGRMSATHFNPAITAWTWMAGKLPSNTALMYLSAQFSAAVSVWILSSLM